MLTFFLAAVLSGQVEAPAEALTSTAAAFGAASSEACRACHPRHHSEWMGSVHAVSDRRLLAAPEGPSMRGRDDPSCRACHGDDLTTVAGLGAARAAHPVRLSHPAERGVACTICHQIMTTPDLDAQARAFREGTFDPYGSRTSLQEAFHRSKPVARLRDPGFCGPCHEVVAPNGVKLERTFSQYLESNYPARQTSCVMCHMRSYGGTVAEGAVLRESVHRHDVIGTDISHNSVPAEGLQRDRVERFLRSAVALFVRSPRRVVAGVAFDLPVEVLNSGAGHNFPTGPSGERRLWLEVEASLDDGTVLTLSPGSVSPEDDGSVSEKATAVFSDRLVDKNGEEVSFWWQASRVEENSLLAHENRRTEFVVRVPENAMGRHVLVSVVLRFQASSGAKLRELGLEELAASHPVFDLHRYRSPPIPVVERLVPESTVRVPTDRPTLAEAIEHVPDGGTILVEPGRYVLDSPLDFRGKAVVVRSLAGTEATILAREFDDTIPDEAIPDAASVVVFQSGEGAGSRLEGFTITGGRGERWLEGRRGGGIVCRGSHPSMVGNRIRGNIAAEGDGGGIFLLDSRARLLGNRIEANRAGRMGGGLAVAGRSEVLLSGSLVYSNRSGEEGGGVYATGGLMVHECLIQGNRTGRGGAIAFNGRSDPDAAGIARVIHRSWVLGNAAVFGGGVDVNGAAVHLERVVIAGNAARVGGGIHLRGEHPVELINLTLTENLASSSGTIRSRDAARPRIRNSIIWGNTHAGGARPELDADVTYSIVPDESFAGGTNISELPLFSRAPGEWRPCDQIDDPGCVPIRWRAAEVLAYGRFAPGDYSILSLSPAMNAGDPADLVDPDGSRREMGAIFHPTPAHGFARADIDGDGAMGVKDLLGLGAYLVEEIRLAAAEKRPGSSLPWNAETPPCLDAADLDDGGSVDAVDAYLLANLLFGFGRPPSRPFPTCGVDPTPDDGLGCFEEQPACR